MHLPQALAFSLALAAPFASAAIFPSNSKVKLLEAKDFRKEVLKPNRTSVVAFVAPWCGHCQRLAPEYAKAAAALDPLVPLYAVDCDAEENKRLCSDQGVKGFPTVKVFPRGDKAPPIPFNEERNAKSVIDFASRTVPHGVRKQDSVEMIEAWASKDTSKPRAVLLSVPKSKDTDMPLLWKVLGNQYKHAISFAASPDAKGKKATALGFGTGTPESRVLVYPAGSTQPVLYKGKLKYAQLSEYFAEILEGALVLNVPTTSSSASESASSTPATETENEAPGASAGGIHDFSAVQGESPTPLAIIEPDQEQVVMDATASIKASSGSAAPAGSAAALHDSSAQAAVPTHATETSSASAESTPDGVIEPEVVLEEAIEPSSPSSSPSSSSAPPSATSEPTADTVADAPMPEPPSEPSVESIHTEGKSVVPEPEPESQPEHPGKRDEL